MVAVLGRGSLVTVACTTLTVQSAAVTSRPTVGSGDVGTVAAGFRHLLGHLEGAGLAHEPQSAPTECSTVVNGARRTVATVIRGDCG